MNFRLTAILFGVLLALTLGLIALTFLDDTPAAGGVALQALADANVKADQIDTVVIERTDPAGKLVLARVGKDRWEIKEPVVARADPRAVDGLVAALLAAKPVAAPETAQPLADLGLHAPSLKVTLRQGSDRAATLNLGKVTIGERGVAFASTDAHPDRAMAVRRTDLDALFRDAARKSAGEPAAAFAKWTSDFRQLRPIGPEPHAAVQQVASLAVTSKGKTLTLTNDKGTWAVAGLGAADLAGDATPTPDRFTGVRPLLAAVTGLSAATPADVIEAPKDLKEYGLNPDNPDVVKVELTPTDGPATVAFIGAKVKDEPGKVYVKLEGDPAVFKATGANVAGLAAAAADPASLRDRNLLAVERTQIDALDLTTGGQTTKLRKTPNGWTLFGGPGDPKPANEAVVGGILDVLAEKRTVRDFPARTDAAFAPPEVKAEVKVYADAVGAGDATKEPDLKDKKPTVLVFGKAEGDAVFVRRTRPDGTTADLLLPQSPLVGPGKAAIPLVETVAKARGDFLDLKLPSFVASLASKLSYTPAGGEPVEVSKSPTADPQYPRGRWAFDLPAARKGHAANADKVLSLLDELASLSALKVVDENPPEAKLKAWGLDPKAPRVRVTVTLDTPDDKLRIYEFGNDDGDKAYARITGKPEVFLVSKYAANRFGPAADLRDPTLLAFDRTRLTGVTLRGWAAPGKPPVTVTLEKKGAAWVATAPPRFAVAAAKVDALVNAIYTARAKAFLPPGKEEYGFGVETQKGLEVTLTLAGLPPLMVNLGAEADGGQNFYAYSVQHPQAALTVPAEPFKALKASPDALK